MNRLVKPNQICFIVFFIILVIFASACQPTPNEAAVIYGGDLEDKIARSSASVSAFEAPQNWQETLDIGHGVNAIFDASVIVPDVTAFPVYKAAQVKLSETKIKPILDYFVQGREIMKAPEPTKDEIENELVLAKKNNDEAWVQDLEGMLQSAPETIEPEYITDWELGPKSEIAGLIVQEDGTYGGIGLTKYSFGYCEGTVYTQARLKMEGKDAVGEVGITIEAATAAAQTVLDDLGIKGKTVSSMEKAELYSKLSPSIFGSYSQTPQSKGYFITFVPNSGGIKGRITENMTSFQKMEYAYVTPFYPEYIDIYVNEQGRVQFFNWFSPFEITETVSDNATLMPFSDMQERIREMIKFIFESTGESVTVDSIEMNMALTAAKDNRNEAIYMPAWYIHCTQDKKMMEAKTGMETNQVDLTLVLNAVDGGVINLDPYYSEDMNKTF